MHGVTCVYGGICTNYKILFNHEECHFQKELLYKLCVR